MEKVFTSIIIALICLKAEPAWAYLDPGSGSAIISAILGAIAAVAFTIKTFWYKIKSMFSKILGNRPPNSDQAQENKE